SHILFGRWGCPNGRTPARSRNFRPGFRWRNRHNRILKKATWKHGSQRRAGHPTLAQRARHEVIAYLAVSGYLLIWFSAVVFYKATILGSVGIQFAPFGLAAVKALILGKFILVMEDLKIGEGKESGGILAVEILKKALLFTLLLFVLSIVEEV